MRLGDTLQKLCQSATQELWLVAPFIKAATLQRLLEGVEPHVNIQCVTRWRPEEIAMGVSDIEIWPLLKARGNTKLWLRHDLHAKYYRADGQCLMGSANITATALGWSAQPNLELLIDVSPQHSNLIGFEKEVLAGAIVVDEFIYHQTQALVKLISQEQSLITPIADNPIAMEIAFISRESWIPTLRNPEQLYIAYIGRQDRLSVGVYESAITDLKILSIPNGLSQAAFETYVAYNLAQMPIVQKIDLFVTQPRRFGEVSAYIKALRSSTLLDFDSKATWQTLMRWLVYFLSSRYLHWIDSYTEMFTLKDTRGDYESNF